ncbi:MAG: response regulator [Pirellulales bacterium]|nr:response regulator [Pirellulales bacterium]MBL7192483.1 response regulator [Pirellulales bacterium]
MSVFQTEPIVAFARDLVGGGGRAAPAVRTGSVVISGTGSPGLPRESDLPPSSSGDASTSILVVDDENDLLELVRYNLTKAGYRVSCVSTGEEALSHARRQPPDLIVLDLMLPAVDGLEVCRRLKADAKTRDIPIIMLTAKSEESDVVRGLERGADDYITKPFSPRVLAARVKALLRRQESQRAAEMETTIDVHELSIHPGRHEVTLAGKPLELTYTEFSLLAFLAKRPGWAYTRMQIVDAVKGEDYPVTERSVDVQVAGLRKKLGRFGSYVETVRGVGYRFRA